MVDMTIKVEPEELRGQAARLAKLSNRMQDITNRTQGAMMAMVGAVSPDLVMNLDWKGKMLLTGLDTLTKGLKLGEQTANNAANLLEDMDRSISDDIVWAGSTIAPVNASNIANDTIEINPDTKMIENMINEQKIHEMEYLMENNQHIDFSTYDVNTYYTTASGVLGVYEKWGGCTWYAMSRYNAQNPSSEGLQFSVAGGNACNWADTINKETFNVLSTSDYNTIQSNSIGIVTSKPGYPYGHVVYIEAVSDTHVYYSDGSWGQDEATWGQVKKCSIEEFASVYDYTAHAK